MRTMLPAASSRLLSIGFVTLITMSCGQSQQTPPPASAQTVAAATDTVATVQVFTDTIRGRVTDAASRAVELSVVMDFELTDDVDRQTALEVGKDVEVVLRHESDGSQTVIAVRDIDHAE